MRKNKKEFFLLNFRIRKKVIETKLINKFSIKNFFFFLLQNDSYLYLCIFNNFCSKKQVKDNIVNEAKKFWKFSIHTSKLTIKRFAICSAIENMDYDKIKNKKIYTEAIHNPAGGKCIPLEENVGLAGTQGNQDGLLWRELTADISQ